MEEKTKQSKSMRFFDRVLELGRDAATLMIIFFMLSISARVIIRYAFGTPINWVVNVSTILQLYLTFLAAAWLLREEGHISIDIVLLFLRPTHRFLAPNHQLNSRCRHVRHHHRIRGQGDMVRLEAGSSLEYAHGAPQMGSAHRDSFRKPPVVHPVPQADPDFRGQIQNL